ncbi:hypothetical protein FJTKL_09048 [Diaporthe vaccinii]|uniref:Clr5 domain-containing protein n=1 Tax=Diaporthe vaccinii TaxID=105482 RepID=A0ABR4EPI7_9PEZI
MRREDGLKATKKQYKGRFQKWGIRKNLSVRKAREIASAQGPACDFWPDTRQRDYERRVARHLKNDIRNQTYKQQVRPSVPGGASNARQKQVIPSPARLKAPDSLENFEKTLYDAEVYVHFTMNRGRTWLASRAELGEDDRFFPLFIGALENLSRNYEPHRAFADIRKAFEHLTGLVALDDPAIYHRLVARFSSFEKYPQSDMCFKVCCLLTRCLTAMYLEAHGPSHPLNCVWSSHIEALESRPEPGLFDHYLESFRTLGQKLYGSRNSLNIGSTDLAKYITSSVRDWDEENLRGGLGESASQASPAPVAQEIRLALTELLLRQGRAEEATQLFGEATALKDLDAAGNVSQVFWMAELEWRAGNADASFALLREALQLADSHQTLPGLVGGAQEEESRLSSLHILHTLIFRLNLMGRKQETAEAWARAAPLVAARRDRKPFVLHLTTSDFEFDLDTRFCALEITD